MPKSRNIFPARNRFSAVHSSFWKLTAEQKPSLSVCRYESLLSLSVTRLHRRRHNTWWTLHSLIMLNPAEFPGGPFSTGYNIKRLSSLLRCVAYLEPCHRAMTRPNPPTPLDKWGCRRQGGLSTDVIRNTRKSNFGPCWLNLINIQYNTLLGHKCSFFYFIFSHPLSLPTFSIVKTSSLKSLFFSSSVRLFGWIFTKPSFHKTSFARFFYWRPPKIHL